MPEKVSATFPPMLSPSLYLQFLRVKAKEPMLSNDDAFLNLHQSINIKDNILVSSIQMSQNDVEEILTSVASSPSSAQLDGFAQPMETPPDSPIYYVSIVDKGVMLYLNVLKQCPKPHHLPHHLPHQLPCHHMMSSGHPPGYLLPIGSVTFSSLYKKALGLR